ncbi:MAG: hypothetical protein PVG66_13215 [Chromatiales bacterium]
MAKPICEELLSKDISQTSIGEKAIISECLFERGEIDRSKEIMHEVLQIIDESILSDFLEYKEKGGFPEELLSRKKLLSYAVSAKNPITLHFSARLAYIEYQQSSERKYLERSLDDLEKAFSGGLIVSKLLTISILKKQKGILWGSLQYMYWLPKLISKYFNANDKTLASWGLRKFR